MCMLDATCMSDMCFQFYMQDLAIIAEAQSQVEGLNAEHALSVLCGNFSSHGLLAASELVLKGHRAKLVHANYTILMHRTHGRLARIQLVVNEIAQLYNLFLDANPCPRRIPTEDHGHLF